MTLLRIPAFAGLIVLLAACGDSGSASSAAPSASTATSAGQASGGQVAGTVPDWTHGPTTVWREGTADTVGRIDADGRLWFHGSAAQGRYGVLERLVPCDTDTFGIDNGEARYEPITLSVEHGAQAWRLLAGSTREAALWLGGHGPTPQAGSSSLQWVHVDGPARIEGECQALMAAGDMDRPVTQRTEYQVVLESGWNLLRRTVLDTTTGADGRDYAMHIRIDAVDAMPEGVAWHMDEG